MVTVSKFFEIQNSAYRSTGPSPPNGPQGQKACAKMGRFDGLDHTCMVLTLRVDPWNDDVRDVGTELLPTNATVDPFVESARWSVIPSLHWLRAGRIMFADGVRRVDMDLGSTLEGQNAYGLFGSFVAGAVLYSEEDARIERCLVNRKLVMGNVISENADIRLDSVHMTYDGHAAVGHSCSVFLPELRNLVRGLESRLVAHATEKEFSS